MLIKNCSRCNIEFKCEADNISNCQCSGIQLNEACRIYLAKTNYNCLCLACLKELIQKVLEVEKHPINNGLIENLHYYWENGLMVFTEFYHISKGRCCKNNCRHCAYGYKKES